MGGQSTGGGNWADSSGSSGQAASDPSLEQLIQQFILQWGLDEVSTNLLRSQAPDYIREVTQSFNPPADTRNVSARFCTFLRGGSGFRQPGSGLGNGGAIQVPALTGRSSLGFSATDQAAIQRFIDTWGLDDNCRSILQTLSPEAVAGVIADFNPPGDTQNINARFMTFVRSRDKGGSGGGSHLAPLVAPQLGAVARRQANDAMQVFVAKWGLDAQSEGLLRQLQPQQLLQVITEFSPPAGTHNVSGRLTAFVKSVLKSSPSAATPTDPAEAFAQNWGLDDDAYQALCALPRGTKEAVMREFNPPPGTLNASGKLKAFIRHRSLNDEGGDRGRGGELEGGGGRKRTWPTFSTGEVSEFVEKWKLDESAEHTLVSLPEDVLADVIKEFNPPPGTWNPSGRLHAFVRARLDRDRAPEADSLTFGSAAGGHDESVNADVRAFVERWGLDGKSQEMLLGLPQELLTTVMTSFEPDAATRNRNAKLASWVRFLQTSQGGQAKRLRY